MQTSKIRPAIAAATSIVSSLGLTVEDASVLHASNKLAVRLVPCDLLARVAEVRHEVAEFEVELAQRLVDAKSPVGALDPRVEPRVYVRDGFAVTLWTYYEPVPPSAQRSRWAAIDEIAPAEYAQALERLHASMRNVEIEAPRFTERVADAQRLIASHELTPELPEADRGFLSHTLLDLRRSIEDRGAPEQLLHGEPHVGNVLRTKDGLLFIDLETCCRGPVEFDIAHTARLDSLRPDLDVREVSEHYPDADRELVRLCHEVALAMIVTWRWDRDDRLPDGRRLGVQWLSQLRAARERLGSESA